MKAIIKGKWIVILAWIAIAVGIFLVAPNMGDLVREKGDLKVPEGYSSTLAGDILKDARQQKSAGDTLTVALVFHNDKGLTDKDFAEAKKAIQKLEANKKNLGITEILTHLNQENLKDQLVSKDGKTMLVSIKHTWNEKYNDQEMREQFYKTIDDVKVEHYFTGSWMISESLMTSSQEGLKKTEGITVGFILVVLLLVFRSLVAPFIPLLTVGFSYIISQSIVAFLVDQFNFPISSYTQIFLVAVLFGIGTDYCILLLSRFKEELIVNETLSDAIISTYKNAGRTVLFSGITVMIGFAAIGFSEFQLYKSAAAVAVGVAVLLIALFTVVPFFMAVLGQKTFWPSKRSAKHAENRLWGLAGKFSLTRPFLSLLLVAIICVPFLLTYDGTLSFNSLEEVSDDVPAIKGFNMIADSFSPGEALSTQVVIKNDEAMDSQEYLELVESISQDLEKVNLVDKVRSATRPVGKKIEDLYIANQAKTLKDGLGQGKDGIDQISDGLGLAESQLTASAPQLEQATTGISSLVTGTNDLQTGLKDIQTNLALIEDGIRKGSLGSTEIIKKIGEAKTGAEAFQGYHQQLLSNYQTIGSQLSQLNTGYQGIAAGITSINDNLNTIDFSKIDNDPNVTGIGNSQEYNKIKNIILGMKDTNQGVPYLKASIDKLNAGLAPLTAGLDKATGTYETLLEKQSGISDGLQALIDGISLQQKGLNDLADGQGKILSHFPEVTNGVSEINNGQQQLLDGFGSLGGQLTDLTDGLSQSVDGLDQISGGLDSAQNYISGLSKSNAFYLPKEVLESEDFAQVFDTYYSPDRKVMTMDVIFKANPYSNEAIDQIDVIKSTVEQAVKGTKLENAEIAIGGMTSTNADLQTMSNNDYIRTVIYMMIGISFILIFLFRSLIMPAYVIGSLILTYYTAMSINEVIFVNILGYSGISWAVPFFAFVILMALGVDYSIFLMDRFNEHRDLSIGEAMHVAMKKMGTVIISAAIILGGTFAAMMPSGMLSLLQIAAIVLSGLMLYAFVVLPLFVPVMVKNFGEANWWPFKRPSN